MKCPFQQLHLDMMQDCHQDCALRVRLGNEQNIVVCAFTLLATNSFLDHCYPYLPENYIESSPTKTCICERILK